MAIRRLTESYTTMIYQKATTAFDGTEPAGDVTPGDNVVFDRGIFRYPEKAAGGLLYWQANEPAVTNQVLVTLASAGNITLSLVTLDDTGVPIADLEFKLAEATGVTFLCYPDYEIVLLKQQAIKLVTTVPGRVLLAASHERTFYH